MHPFEVAQYIGDYGYTYTYWYLRNFWAMSRLKALWLIWVARQYSRHINDRSILTDLID